MSDYSMGVSYDELVEFWSTPKLWQTPGERNPFDHRNEALFALASDQFFMLGDNSPMSMDARLWDGEQYVSRELLVGKAIYIFWPHSFDKFPGTNIPFPFFPNFARMRLIR
jgi:signal peptidase I